MKSGTVFNSTNYGLENLVSDVDSGIIALPDLQRPFVWKDKQIRDLFDSLYKGLPAGLIILWKIDSVNEFKAIGLSKATTPNRLVIDGQQRLTSLFSVIKNKEVYNSEFRLRKPKIAFNPITEEFQVSNSSIHKSSEWINDISDIYTKRLRKCKQEYLNNLKEKKPDFDIDEDLIEDNIDRLNEIKHYPFSVLELSQELDPEEVSEIFVRINSKGKVLNQSDFILTLMSIYWDEGRKKLEEFSKDSKNPSDKENSPYNLIKAKPTPENLLRSIVGYSFLRGRLKYAYSILKGRDLKNNVTTEDERNKNFDIFKEGQSKVLNLTNWHDYIKIIQSLGFVDYNLISSKNTFYATYSLYLLGKYKFNIEFKALESIISRWFIFTLLTQRYTSSPESFIESDLVKFREDSDFVEVLDSIIKSELTDDYWKITIPQRLVSSISNNVDKVYIASQIKEDKNLLFSNIKLREHLSPVVKSPKKQVERHHIFPKNYLKKQGVDQTHYNQRANMIYIEYRDNIKISDKAPSEYWSLMLENLSENNRLEIEENYTSYYDLPFEFWKMDYSEFLEERRKLMALSIENYFKKL